MRSVPKLKELAEKHADQGLVLIGVHSTRGGEKMADFVADKGIGYPVAIDRDGATVASYGVDGYPDYHVIDRTGKVRIADLPNGELESAIRALLAEPAPGESSVAAPVAKATEAAVRKRTQVLSVFGSTPDQVAFKKLASVDPEVQTLLRYEYQLANVDSAKYPEAFQQHALDGFAMLVAQSSTGEVLGAIQLSGLKPDTLGAFLKEHQLPQLDAEKLWADAKAQAQREQKRVLVHLGAPW